MDNITRTAESLGLEERSDYSGFTNGVDRIVES